MGAKEIADSVFKVNHINNWDYSAAIIRTKEILAEKEITQKQLEVLMKGVEKPHRSDDKWAYYIPYVNLVNFLDLFN